MSYVPLWFKTKQIKSNTKMKKLQLFFLAALAILLVNCATEKNKTVSVTSPDGKNTIQFEIKDGVPIYAVIHAETSVVNPSKLGFIFKDGDTFNSGFTVVDSKTSTFEISTSWNLYF